MTNLIMIMIVILMGMMNMMIVMMTNIVKKENIHLHKYCLKREYSPSQKRLGDFPFSWIIKLSTLNQKWTPFLIRDATSTCDFVLKSNSSIFYICVTLLILRCWLSDGWSIPHLAGHIQKGWDIVKGDEWFTDWDIMRPIIFDAIVCLYDAKIYAMCDE